MVDIHCHILPGIDDGSKDVEMSIGMLREMKKQGTDLVCATPHYYPTETVDEFLARRNESYLKLKDALKEVDPSEVPEIRLGAEVYYNHMLLRNPDFRKLRYEGTDCILLEMPWEKWSSQCLDDVEVLGRIFGVHVIIAHLERYYAMTDKRDIKRLLKFGYFIQMNAGALINEETRKESLKMFQKNHVSFVASDAHNLTSRKPNLEEAMKILRENKLECRQSLDF